MNKAKTLACVCGFIAAFALIAVGIIAFFLNKPHSAEWVIGGALIGSTTAISMWLEIIDID